MRGRAGDDGPAAAGHHVLPLRARRAAPTTPRDLALAQEIAFRTALALDNARLYQEAQAAVRSRDNVMAIVSHDLRNPLNAIALNLSLLTRPWTGESGDGDRRKRPQPARVDQALGAAGGAHDRRPARRLDHPVRALHGARRARSARRCCWRTWCRRSSRWPPTGASPWRPSFPSGLPAVSCDRDRVLQVFGNLCGNALHVTPQGGFDSGQRRSRKATSSASASSDTGPGHSRGAAAFGVRSLLAGRAGDVVGRRAGPVHRQGHRGGPRGEGVGAEPRGPGRDLLVHTSGRDLMPE